MSCTSICKLIPHFYSVAEQQWVQAPEHIKHCLLNRLFALHAVNFFCRCGTSASKLLCPHLPHERSTMARGRGHRHQPQPRDKRDFCSCMKAASRGKKKHTAAFGCCFLKTKLKPLKFSFLTSFAVVVLPLQVSVIITITAMEAAGPRAA